MRMAEQIRRRILLRCQVEKRLVISKNRVYQLLDEGKLAGFKEGRDWRIFEDSVERYEMERQGNFFESETTFRT